MIELNVWGWTIALYLFLGGLGSGTFITATILHVLNPAANRKTVVASAWIAIVCLAVGLLLLLTDLTAPLRAFLFWQSFSNFSSWMAIGAWLLLFAMIFMAASALMLTEKTNQLLFKGRFAAECTTIKVITAIASVLCLCVAGYTGILLMSAPGIAFWNTPLLPCLFTVSALDTGIALVVILSTLLQKDDETARSYRHKLEIVVLVLVAVETAVFVAFASLMASGNAASFATGAAEAQSAIDAITTLMAGEYAGAFWVLFVGLGLAAPFVAAIAGLASQKKYAGAIGVIGACCALVGGCALRFLILFAGQHGDILVTTLQSIVF